MKSSSLAAFLLAAVLTATGSAFAQSPAPVSQTATAVQTGTVSAIDYTARVVTIAFPDGSAQAIQAGPDITRFNALKVGDKVTFTATESMVYAISAPGAPAAPDTQVVQAIPGGKPGGVVTKTQSTTVTVKAIDAAAPSVTILTADGRTMSFLVKDPKNLAGVKVGDKVNITYTQSLMISVK
jgi:Cu/Ag efflux protein CusF